MVTIGALDILLNTLQFPYELEVTRQYTFTFNSVKTMCCGAGHCGCRFAEFDIHDTIVCTELTGNSIKCNVLGDEFFIPLYRLKRCIKENVFVFKNEEIQKKLKEG